MKAQQYGSAHTVNNNLLKYNNFVVVIYIYFQGICVCKHVVQAYSYCLFFKFANLLHQLL